MSHSRRSSSSSRKSSSSSGERKKKKGKDKPPSFKYMITEAIWEEKKYQKGTSRPTIRNFITNHYDVDEDKLKANLSATINKMLQESDGGYPLLVRVGENYKLSPEWRKEWTKKYGKKQTKRKRRKKASDEPKHPRNGYLFYSQEVRKRRQDQHPDMSFPELTRLIADEWKNLGKKKKKYEDLASADRERYKKEKKAYDKKKERERSSGSDSESSSPRKRSRTRKSESSEDSKRSPNKRRRRQSESDSESRDRTKKKSDSELKRSKANSDDEGSRGGKDKKSK